MKILICLPCKATNDPLITLAKEYLAKCRTPLNISPLLLAPKSSINEEEAELRKSAEAKMLLEKTAGYRRIALDERGASYSSTSFAKYLEKLCLNHQKAAFIIGGALGLPKEFVNSADDSISLSSMTLPHRLAFLMLSEQIYRASEIMRGSPYHK